jgi:APA family basic amino acid/polyamine antiporter
MSRTPLPTPAVPQLRRALGGFDAFCVLIGCVMGSGVFVVAGQAAATLPSAWGGLGLWAAAGAISLAGAVCLAELVAGRPEAGGPYAYLRIAYGEMTGFLYGWTALVVVNTAVSAALATGFALFVGQLVPLSAGGVRAVEIAVILAAAATGAVDLRVGKWLQNALTVAKLLGAALVVAVVLVHGPPPLAALGAWRGPGPFDLHGTALGALAIVWTFDGWTYLAFSGGEARDPRRSLPLGLLSGLATVTLAYLLINAAYYVALPPPELLGSETAAASAVAKSMGPLGRRAVAALVSLSIFGSLTAMFLTGTRCLLAMARDGLLARRIGRVDPVLRTPVVAVAFQAAVSVALLSVGGFFEILSVSFVADWIFKIALVAAVVVGRRRGTSPAPSYRAPFYPWLPLGFCACAAGLVLLSVVAEPRSAELGALLVVSGAPVYLLVRRWRRRRELSAPAYMAVGDADLGG